MVFATEMFPSLFIKVILADCFFDDDDDDDDDDNDDDDDDDELFLWYG